MTTSLITGSLRTGVLPREWKLASVTSVHKKGDKANYHATHLGLTMQLAIAKVFENLSTDNFTIYSVSI